MSIGSINTNNSLYNNPLSNPNLNSFGVGGISPFEQALRTNSASLGGISTFGTNSLSSLGTLGGLGTNNLGNLSGIGGLGATSSLNPVSNPSLQGALEYTSQGLAERFMNRLNGSREGKGSQNYSSLSPYNQSLLPPGLGFTDFMTSILANTLPFANIGGKWGSAVQSLPALYQVITGGLGAIKLFGDIRQSPPAENILSSATEKDMQSDESFDTL